MELIIIGVIVIMWVAWPRRKADYTPTGPTKWTSEYVPPARNVKNKEPEQAKPAVKGDETARITKDAGSGYLYGDADKYWEWIRQDRERRERAKSKEYLIAPVFAMVLLLLLVAGVVWIYSNILVLS